MSIMTSAYRYQVGDRVSLNESEWAHSSTGNVVEIQQHDRPKRTVYRVELDDGQEVYAEDQHLRPAYERTASDFDDFLFGRGHEVMTPLGPGKVSDRAETPLGRLYRIEMDYGGFTRDFLEHEVHLLRSPSVMGGS